ncbi:glycosyltransferase [Thermosynechococcus sp. CL-1]|uniref:glycosyltransferase family 2 protein n=1 Tax=Thermosynechococcus sp. CL-1 TaxID=2583530 RepID=UPI00122DD427|nr:glycosyltransferase [Thermosynechococcus sp. CL-1]QEQ01508.1 glycosyltransferase [Thermosynechococcus sp. CL-1]
MSSQDKPLVTFAVFAYNQEQFIREAIEGAFSQTYEPLEIILSDDCSSDRTFEIMQEMVANYRGKHQVRARRNPHNTGTLDHLLIVAKEAKGQLLVVAAGDDVSLPHRTETLVNHWIKNPCHALCSGYNEIDDEGNLIAENKRLQYVEYRQSYYRNCLKPKRFENQKVRGIAGASAAYDIRIIQKLPLSNQNILIEDLFMSHIINLEGGSIEWIQVPLINHRINSLSISSFATKEMNYKYKFVSYRELIYMEKKLCFFNQALLKFYNYLFDFINYYGYPDSSQFIENVKANPYFRLISFQVRYGTLNFFQRIGQLFKISQLSEFKFSIARLFGIYPLCFLKSLASLIHKFS